MKTCLLLFLGAFLAVIPMTSASDAQASGPNSAKYVVAYCKDEIVPSGLASSVGECVSLENTSYHYFTNDSDGFATHWCALLRDDYPSEYDAVFAGWTDCVRTTHEVIGK